MGLFEQLPYTNFHDLNLTELVKFVRMMGKELQDFEALNKITYRGDWDITKQYPAWSVVCVNGTEGYISIKPVPLGVDYTNNDYWRLIADFTVQLSGLANRVSDLENDNVTNKADIVNLKGDVVDINNSLTDLYGLRNNTTRKIICISDSYGLTPSLSDSWIAKFQYYMGITNDNFYRSQVNGSGFIGNAPADTFQDQLTDVASLMSADEKADIDDIVIAGGWNDAQQMKNGAFTDMQLVTAVRSCITYARATFPNAKIWISFVGWSSSYFNEHPFVRTVINIYSQACFINDGRVCYIDGVNWLHRRALLSSDYVHPNATGADAIGKTLSNVLTGGCVNCDLAPDGTGKIVPNGTADSSNVSTFTWNNVYQLYSNGIATMSWDEIQFTVINQLNSDNELKLLDFNDGIISGGNYATNGAKFPCVFKHNGTHYNGYILIHNNALWFTPFGLNVPAGGVVRILFGSGSCDILL